MGLNLDYADGQTPLDEDEKEDLLIPTITNQGELDEFEQQGVEKANEWLLGRKLSVDKILTEDFIKDLIKGEGLLDKKVYLVIPFSQLELGPMTVAPQASNKKGALPMNDRIKSGLLSKRNNVLAQVERMGLLARPLSTNELIKLFYEIYNQEFITLDFDATDVKNVIM